MNDLLLIAMYIGILVLLIGSPYMFITMWKKEQKEIADTLAYNKWFYEERAKTIRKHKIELMTLRRKRMEMELRWELDEKARLARVEREIDAQYQQKWGH